MYTFPCKYFSVYWALLNVFSFEVRFLVKMEFTRQLLCSFSICLLFDLPICFNWAQWFSEGFPILLFFRAPQGRILFLCKFWPAWSRTRETFTYNPIYVFVLRKPAMQTGTRLFYAVHFSRKMEMHHFVHQRGS